MSPAQHQARTIIVADDENHIRAVVAAKLRNAGLHVLEARDGQEALGLAEANAPDLVITDLQMPVMSGLELCQALKRTAATERVPALLLTARGFILTDDEVARTNIRLVMSKPFSARELVGRAMEILVGPAGAASQEIKAA